MSSVRRIAIVDRSSSGLQARLEAALPAATCHAFDDVVDDFDAILEFAPDTVAVALHRVDAELIGALRVLRRGMQAAYLLFEVDEEALEESRRLAARIEGRVLGAPAEAAQLAAALQPPADDLGPAAAAQEALIDLTRGISDEINNPLLFLTGHVQLLESLCDPSRDADKLEQIAAVRRGLDRIAETMSKMRVMSRAHSLHRPLAIHRLGEILERILADTSAAVRPMVPTCRGDLHVACDPRLLEAALRYLFEIGSELSRLASRVQTAVLESEHGLLIRTEINGLDFEEWQLPRAFDPYHLKHSLRGTTHGLNLFLVQTVIQAHGGTATARRNSDNSLTLDLTLPTEREEQFPGRS